MGRAAARAVVVPWLQGDFSGGTANMVALAISPP